MCRVTRPGQPVFAKHDLRAELLRAELDERGTALVNLFSGGGCGSTSLLRALLVRAARRGLPVAAFAALNRLPSGGGVRDGLTGVAGAQVRPLLTDGLCHLEPAMLDAHLRDWPPRPTRLLLVENSGEPSCPAPYGLGESLRVALASVTEGEDRPWRAPLGFGPAHLVVVTRDDLAEAVDFDRAAFLAAVERVNPGVPVVFTSARRGDGLDRLLDLLLAVASGAEPHHPVLTRGPAPLHAHGARAGTLRTHAYADAFSARDDHGYDHGNGYDHGHGHGHLQSHDHGNVRPGTRPSVRA